MHLSVKKYTDDPPWHNIYVDNDAKDAVFKIRNASVESPEFGVLGILGQVFWVFQSFFYPFVGYFTFGHSY
jgi:hypothetical protein